MTDRRSPSRVAADRRSPARRARDAWRRWDLEGRRHDKASDQGDHVARIVLESRSAGVLSPVQLAREVRRPTEY